MAPASDPPKRRGRPRVENPAGSGLTTWLPAALHDRLIVIAKAREESVSATARQAITQFVDQRVRKKS